MCLMCFKFALCVSKIVMLYFELKNSYVPNVFQYYSIYHANTLHDSTHFYKNLKMETPKLSILFLLSAACILTAAILIYTYFRTKLKVEQANRRHLVNMNQTLTNELAQERKLIGEEKERNQHLLQECSTLQTEYKNLRANYENKLNDTDGQLRLFESIANRVLQHQSASFQNQQKRDMKHLLQPLQEKIHAFETKVDFSNTESVKRHQSLKEQIRFLSSRSEQISQDANNLAKALRGDFKQQGNWGELILESILDKSGLEKDREYFVQQTERDENGKMKKPDVVIHLPDGKRIVIDSKVSLNAYDRLVNAQSKEETIKYRKAHQLAVRKHISDLSGKAYHTLYNIQSPDFVLMFVPIDTAFSIAEKDGSLYSYAFEKNIVIVTPSTLLATLKTVESIWRNEKQNRHAMEIANEAGKMYDKFVGFLTDMDKIGKQISTVQYSFQDSMKKLHSGNGNLIKRAEKIKSLGAKTNKRMSENLVQLALD